TTVGWVESARPTTTSRKNPLINWEASRCPKRQTITTTKDTKNTKKNKHETTERTQVSLLTSPFPLFPPVQTIVGYHASCPLCPSWFKKIRTSSKGIHHGKSKKDRRHRRRRDWPGSSS